MVPKQTRAGYIKCAKELKYPKAVIEKIEKAETEKIEKAETENEICFIMRTARKESLK